MDSIQATTVDLPRFGTLEFAETDVIEFPWGLPGFSSHRRWLLLTLETHPGYIWLQSLDDVKVAIPTAEPSMIFEGYEPKLPAYCFVALDIENPEDFALLGVVVVTENAEEMTMNLMAPIVVNLKARKARQVMLENSSYSVREPIPRKASAASTEEAATP
jgi:flagellar assembly factor FliW